MAARLIGAGLPLTVNNRNRGKAETLFADGARWAQSPAEAADNANVVLTCVTNNQATGDVLFGHMGVTTATRVKRVVDFSTSGLRLPRVSASAFGTRVSPSLMRR